MPLIVSGQSPHIENAVNIARHYQKVELHPEAFQRIIIFLVMLERKSDKHEIIFGANTVIGEYSEVVLNDAQVKDFQNYLIS